MDSTKVVVNSQIPKDKAKAEELWNLWKLHKDLIKNDGFSIKKFGAIWQIAYFHTITEDSFEKTTIGEDMWKAQFNKKIQRWSNVISKNREAAERLREEMLEDEIIEDEDITNTMNDMTLRATRMETKMEKMEKIDAPYDDMGQ
jgi:hypothetical protein